MMKRFLLYTILATVPISCKAPQQAPKVPEAGFQMIEAAPDKRSEEQPEVACNGVIVSEHDIPVYSRLSSLVEELNIKEGTQVSKGQVLVEFDSREMDINVRLEQNQLDQAVFQYKTILIGQGYDTEKEADIPESVRKAARVRSSVELCESRLENAMLHRSYCTVTSPIDGVITDLTIHKYDFVREGAPLFHIVDTRNLSVEFYVLETDLKHFKTGTCILAHPIADEQTSFTAEVSSIGKKVNEEGMVRIKARLRETEKAILGMNVLISLQ